MKTSFWSAGHKPTLIAAFLYFDLAFMVWVLLGPLAPQIAMALGLSPAQKGLMVAVPTLAGAILRIVNGLLVDRIGPKKSGAISQVIVIAGLLFAWMHGVNSFAGTLALGVILGFAGASFAIALPLASRWYSGEHQGKAMGIAGMGNSGTVFASLFAPTLAKLFGWNAVLGLACIPLSLVFVAYMIMAKDAPDAPPAKPLAAYLEPLKTGDAWWFMLFYGVTFGGFVGLAASLSIYFTDQFGLTAIVAGYCTAGCVFAGSLVRPLGGALADRVGGIKTLSVVYTIAAIALTGVSTGPSSLFVALGFFVLAMLALGTGNGAVFQLVPQRFRAEIGVMTGLVGFAGGIGGFYLSSSLGFAKQLTGSYQYGFLIFAGVALLALVGLSSVKRRWRTTWGAAIQGVRI
jgi:NNP family nitrate/nitrite transporter-like MFS transporter